jgi:hypothetical protein
MAIEKKGEITLTYGTLLLYWDSENYKMLCILKVGDQYIGTFKTFLSIEKDLSDSKTFSEILTYGFGAKNRYDSLGNLLSWLNRTDDFSITAIFRKPLKDEIAIVHDKKEDAKIDELKQKAETLDLRFRKNDYFANLYSGQTIDSPERMKYEEIKRHTESKIRQNENDVENVQNVIDIQEGVIARLKDNAITSALMFDVLYKPVISGNLEYLLESMVPMYRNAEQSIKAKLQQFGLKTTEIKDFNIAVSLFVPSLFNPEYYNGVSHPAAQAFAKTLKNFYEAYLADDIKHEGYSLGKQYSPAVIFEQIITSNVNKPENAEKIHIPDPRMFHVDKKTDLLLPFGFAVKSINQQKITNVPVPLKINELSRSLTLFGLQGFGKSLTLCSIALGLYYHGIKGIVIDPHGTLTGMYKPLTNREVITELESFGVPVKQMKPANGKIYTVLSDDGIRFSTQLFANPIPDSITNELDRQVIARMYARGLFTDMIPNYCEISPSNPEMAYLENYCVERFMRNDDVSLEILEEQIRKAEVMAKFRRIVDLKPLIDSDKPTNISKIITDDGISTVLLSNLNVYAPPNARNIPMDMIFYSLFNGVHKYSQSLDYETSKTERVLIADELGVMDRNMSVNADDYIGKCVREDRKRGTGYVLGSQRSVHISPSARSTNMSLYFRTNLMNDIKTLKAMYPEEDGDNVNDVSLLSKLPRGYVFADLGSDFYSKPMFLKVLRPCCQHTGLTAGEIREMMAPYKEDNFKAQFNVIPYTDEEKIIYKLKELADKGISVSKNRICSEVGGEKQRILSILNTMIDDGRLNYDVLRQTLSLVRTENQF